MNDRQVHTLRLKEQLAKAQLKMKQEADRKCSDVEFQVGDLVLLKLQPYVQRSVVSHPFPKLAMKYYGPYKVLARIGKTAYTLELPADSLIHPTFHVSQLKIESIHARFFTGLFFYSAYGGFVS